MLLETNSFTRFAALPKPKETDWELELPEEQAEPDRAAVVQVEDAADRDKRHAELRKAAERARFRRQTQVIQRALPRPSVVDIDSLQKNAANVFNPVERLIAQEMAVLVANDAVKFPLQGGRVRGTIQNVDEFDEDTLTNARMEILLEQPEQSLKHGAAELQRAWEETHQSTKLPGLAEYGEDEIDEHQLMVETFDVSLCT